MRILAIETSCDETSLAVVEAEGGKSRPRFHILANLVSSQIAVHRPFGGVVPNLAKREHEKNLPILLKKLLDSRFHILDSIDLIAVTVGPGLEPALWAGIEFAKWLSKKLGKPLVGANHLEGHLYSFLLQRKGKRQIANRKSLFPAVALIVSGGHTLLLSLPSLTKRKRLGETRDDAAGEAFDKVARMLELPYPGGPEVEKLARKGNKSAIPFPRPMLGHGPVTNYNFSFSGLKTAVLYRLRDHRDNKADVAASFQEAVVDVLVKKTIAAAMRTGARAVLLSGGVAANKALRARLRAAAQKEGMAFFAPEGILNTDNAAMIAVAAHVSPKKYHIAAQGNLLL
ncbi:MAG: tRNA (adenosine(37)-N6)-threonylcarbamoyltransferase complex transferase subunit TsaD [bacterium]|nr:tRNA (adenosine(37)-N6)-threonylcarbamoyltransferase complex transferase subunit TsaD [bacterium]